MPSYNVYSGDSSALAAKINSTQTSGVTIAAMNINGTLTGWANTAGVIEVSEQSDSTLKREWIYYTGTSVDATTKVATLSGVVRGISSTTSDVTSGGTGVAFSKGATVRFVTFHDLLNKKANLDRANSWTGTNTFGTAGSIIFTNTTSAAFIAQNVTTAQRDALTGVSNGAIIYNSSVGQTQFREGGAWVSNAAGGSVADASTTVAGKVEISTAAERATATATGGTGAVLVVSNDALVKTSSGSGDENKVPVLNSSGELDSGFVKSVGDILFGDASDGNVTLSTDTTMTRDMYYDTLNLSTFTLNTAGYRVFARTITGTGKIKAPTGGNGGNGGNASGVTQGSAGSDGSAVSAGSLPAGPAGVAGGAGATGRTNSSGTGSNGSNASAGSSVTNAIASTSGSSGANGASGGNGGGGNLAGSGGTGASGSSSTAINRQTPMTYQLFATNSGATFTAINGSGISGGGGGGGAGGAFGSATYTSGGGGGGGGSGANGGYWFISAKKWTGSWNIESIGGTGGNGGNGGNATVDSGGCGGGGGGGGGAGGNGGCGIAIRNIYSAWTGSIVLTGGAGGTGGSGGTLAGSGANGSTGSNGNNGSSGTAITINIP